MVKRLSLLLSLFLLCSCSFSGQGSNSRDESQSDGKTSNSETSGESIQSSSEDEPEVTTSIQDAPIFHAWDWSVTDIKNNLSNIKSSGFKAIQLSPMQPSKNINGGDTWWNIYQPMGFKVATGNESPIGTKQQLKELCDAAYNDGISVVMDVVCNHLAQGAHFQLFKEGKDWSGKKSVQDFEAKICDDNLVHSSSEGYADTDADSKKIVKGSLGGLPDLQTENEHVQSRVISMLKEYIDCGVRGFRFDAAKHIETPSDGNLGSNFWSNVIESINSYGELKYDSKPYIYGEILYTPGNNRNWDWYTSLMSVTEASQGKTMVEAVSSKNIGGMINSNLAVSNDKAVLWAESHDTWAHPNDYAHTTQYSDEVINLTYAIQTARKGTASLYFCRPQDHSNPDNAPNSPQVISAHDDDYKSSLIKGVNNFHNTLLGANESFVNSNNNAAVIVRKSSKNEGAFIANPNFDSTLSSVNVTGLSDGEYTDLIANKTYRVSGGVVSDVKLTDGGCALVKNPGETGDKPSVTISAAKEYFKATTSVTLSVNNATSASYSINGGSKTSFSGNKNITVGNEVTSGAITISVEATNANGNTTKNYTVYKTDLIDKSIVIKNVPEDTYIAVYNWNSGSSDEEWIRFDSIGSLRALNLASGKNNYIIVKLKGDLEPNWGNVDKQTDNLEYTKKVDIDYSDIVYK